MTDIVYDIEQLSNGVFVVPMQILSADHDINMEAHIADIGERLRAHGVIVSYSDYIDTLTAFYPQHVSTIMQQAIHLYK